MEIVRTEVSKKSDKTHKKSTKKSSPSKKKAVERISKEALKKQIINKLSLLNINEEDFQSRSQIIFLESVILWEFGDALVNDSMLSTITKDVREAITSNKTSKNKLNSLIEQLVS
jgi:hypothetical protein